MPIKGMTDKSTQRLPEAGRLHKGAPKTGNKPGKDLTYFRFEGTIPGARDAWEGAFPPEPRRIGFYIPAKTPEIAFSSWYESWSKTGLVHRCDREWIVQELNSKGGYDTFAPGEKPCPYADNPDVEGHSPIGRLEMIVPELVEAGIVGTVLFKTSSKNDIVQIQEALNAVFALRHDLRGIRFNLYRAEKTISTPPWKKGGKRKSVDKWLCFVAPEAEWLQAQIQRATAAAYSVDAELEEPGMEETLDQAPEVDTGAPEEAPARQALNFGRHKGQGLADVYAVDPSYVWWLFYHQDDWKEEAHEFLERQLAKERPYDFEGLKSQLRSIYRGTPQNWRNAHASSDQGGFMVGLLEKVLTKEQRKDLLDELFGFRTIKSKKCTWAICGSMLYLLKKRDSTELRDVARQELKAYAGAWNASADSAPTQFEMTVEKDDGIGPGE